MMPVDPLTVSVIFHPTGTPLFVSRRAVEWGPDISDRHPSRLQPEYKAGWRFVQMIQGDWHAFPVRA